MLHHATAAYRAVLKLNQPDDNYKFRPLPPSTGAYPYHLQHPTKNTDKITFHMVGDTGGFRDQGFQHKVAVAMAGQTDDTPEFLYHLGDIVYSYGEAHGYAGQFFKPYECYPAPIYAIAGNHDSDVNPAAEKPYQSLDAFRAVFCDTVPRKVTFGGDTLRQSGVQPNIYWTLDTPLATIIGMYSNVPKYGVVTDVQRAWLIDELRTADRLRPAKALILAIHHAPYSADTNHGASVPMIQLLEGVFEETGIRPDLVASGHVHNYQRFQKKYPDCKPLTYLVAGAGGYDELHGLASADDERFSAESPLFDNLNLMAYQDGRHGFLKISLKKERHGVDITGEYYLINDQPDTGAGLADSFVIKVR